MSFFGASAWRLHLFAQCGFVLGILMGVASPVAAQVILVPTCYETIASDACSMLDAPRYEDCGGGRRCMHALVMNQVGTTTQTPESPNLGFASRTHPSYARCVLDLYKCVEGGCKRFSIFDHYAENYVAEGAACSPPLP